MRNASTSSRIEGDDLPDHGAPDARAVLEQVVHDQRAEDQAAGQADQRVDARDHFRDEALRDCGGRLLRGRLGILERLLVDVEIVDRLLDRRVDRASDVVRLLDHAPHGCDDDDGHECEQAEDDQAGAERGLQAAALEVPDERLEDHGQHRREEQGEHDLAHRAECDDDDHGRRDDSHEAPGPDPKSGYPVHASTSGLGVAGHGTRVAGPRPAGIVQPGDCTDARASSDPDDAMRSRTAYGDWTPTVFRRYGKGDPARRTTNGYRNREARSASLR